MSIETIQITGSAVFILLVFCLLVLIIIALRQLVKQFYRQNVKGSIQVGTLTYPYELGKIIVSTTEAYGIQIRLPARLPEIIVDSHRNDHLFQSLNFAALESQRLELEGDFYQDFSIYVPTGFEQVALHLLSPAVMLILINDGQAFDLETYGTTLNLYAQNDPLASEKQAGY